MAIHNARKEPPARSCGWPSRTRSSTRHGPLRSPYASNILSRKTLSSVETNLDSQVMRSDGTPSPGLFAGGEVAGFGGGGVHGYNALEGALLGGCIFSGRAAGLALAKERA